MSAQVTSNAFSDPITLFATREDANAWRLSLEVPSMENGVEGVASKAQLPSDPVLTVTPTYDTINTLEGDGSTTTIETPSKQSFIDLQAQVEELKATVIALLAAQVSSGQGEQ